VLVQLCHGPHSAVAHSRRVRVCLSGQVGYLPHQVRATSFEMVYEMATSRPVSI
jgi:hypothetical protein